MYNLILIIIALLAVFLIFIVLIQAPKGRGLDSNFGGGAANQLLGASQSADIIEKITWGLISGIIVLCLAMAFLVRPSTSTTTPNPKSYEVVVQPTELT